MTTADVRGERGMVATSHPLAARAGVDILEAGGSAADAAVAAAAVLNVVDPRSTGIGGDAFGLVWPAGAAAPAGLAGAGPSARSLTAGAVRAAGHDEMPGRGAWSVTVPGSVSAWERLLERYGRLSLDRVLAPAIRIADEGFEVAPIIAGEWADAGHRLADDEAARTLFLPDGKVPQAGDRLANPELAETFRTLVRDGARGFYTGELAERIGAAVEAAGGPLRADDLAAWKGAQWVDPISVRFRGIDVFQIPPPGQGIVLLEALGIFDGLDCDTLLDEEHAALEALKLAFADAAAYVADPDVVDVPTAALLSPDRLAARRAEIDMATARAATAGRATDTVYVAVVDGEGTGCSFIQSLYEGFGSGIAVPGTGMLLQNRGSNFVLEDGHPNQAAGGKRPYHTIIPGMVGENGGFRGCLGVVGGFMQPQGQMQILRHVLDHGMGLQAALDAPRARWIAGRRVAIEPDYDAELARGLEQRGHELEPLGPYSGGGAQAILARDGVLTGATDKRKDGVVLAV